MAITWPGVPTFVDGQVMSASEHLNALARAVHYLFGLYQSTLMVFPSYYWVGSHSGEWDGWFDAWAGHIRHKANTIRFAYRISGETVIFRVQYGTTVVWTSDPITHIGEETGEITADISGAGLTVDGFYAVAVEMQRATGDCQLCWIVILEVAEVATLSLPTLPDCDDDDVLTAAQWNDLSEYAEALAAAALAPRPGFPSRSTHHTNALNSLFWGGLRKLSNTLRLQVWWRALDESAEVRIVINDTNVLDITHDTPASTTADNSELAATPFTGYTNYTPYYGSVDLSSLGLATGACYTLEVRCSDDEGIMDTWSHASVDYLYQELDTSPDTTGWVNLSEWAHGNYVGGSTGTPKVQDIKADLAWLGARITNANVAARQRYADETPGTPRGSQTREFELWMIHTHRWLWFLGELDDSPLLRYYADGWQDVSLPVTEDYGWHVYDLDQLPLLAHGQRYQVRGAFAAIEDINA